MITSKPSSQHQALSRVTRLTVVGDLDGPCLVFAQSHQHNRGVEDVGSPALLQQVKQRLCLLPTGAQDHSYGLEETTDNILPDKSF